MAIPYYMVNYYDNYDSIPNLPSTYTLTNGVSTMTTDLPVFNDPKADVEGIKQI